MGSGAPLPPEPIARDRIPADLASPYWEKIRRGEPLVVSLNPDLPPFSMKTREGKRIGFDADLARHLGKTLGVPVKFIYTKTRDQLAVLASGKCDLVLAGLTRTPRRAAVVNWSVPYLEVSQAALIDKNLAQGGQRPGAEVDTTKVHNYFDLARLPGLRIGVKENTRPASLARRYFGRGARVVPYPSAQAAASALVKGDVSAFVHDAPFLRVWLATHPRQRFRFKALLEPVTREPICIAMRKGDLEFLRWLDVYVEEVRANGTVSDLQRRYFSDMAWTSDVDMDE